MDKNKEKDIIQESELNEEEEVLTLSDDMFSQILGKASQNDKVDDLVFINEPIDFEPEEFEELFDSKEFKEGQKIALKYGAMFATLTRMGVDVNTASTMCINQQTLEHNKKIQELSVNGSVKVAKTAVDTAEKQSL